MPLIRISLRQGKSSAYRKALADGIYLALRQTFNVPEDDLFVTISEHEDDNFFYGATSSMGRLISASSEATISS